VRLRADQKLFLTYLTLIAILTVTMSYGADVLLRRNLLETTETDLRRELALARAFYDATLVPPDSAARLLGGLSGRRVTIVDLQGTPVGESSDAPSDRLINDYRTRPEVVQAMEGQEGRAIRFSTTLGVEHLYLALQSARGEVIRLAVSLADVDAALREVQRGILAMGVLAVLLAGIFSFGFSIALTRPIRRIGDAARAIAAGDLSRRIRPLREDELGDLGRALNGLADELQRRLGQLEGERAEMQALIDSMSEAVLALAPDGTLRRTNPAARRIFALGAEPEGIPPERVMRRPEFLRLVSSALAGEAVQPREISAGGHSLLATAHPLPDGGAVLVFLDISELRRLEEVRRDFVANASHELKTPLTAIRGYSETLLDPELPPELVRKFADVVRSNAERLQRIVDDLLDLSRIEAGGWITQSERVSVPEAALDVWPDETRRRDSSGVRLRFDLEPGSEHVWADPGGVRQILANLFSNAIRYTPDGGCVIVRTRDAGDRPVAPASGEAGRGWTVVEVEDTGAGIPGAHLSRIFERFYRVDPARSREEGGTGLGLSIVRHLVEAHGGWIEAESQVGTGTVIRFVLPCGES
jgi:two-component system, OmpR family, phosphate regulon sensor histidine kinase PhoR